MFVTKSEMNSNVFLQYPLNQIYTLFVQNHSGMESSALLKYQEYPFYQKGGDSTNGFPEGTRPFFPLSDDEYLNRVASNMVVYDFIRDNMVSVKDIPNLTLVLGTPGLGALSKALANKNSGLNPDMLILFKGIRAPAPNGNGYQGGLILPLVATIKHMTYALKMMGGTGASVLDALRTNEPKVYESVQSLLNRPLYSDPTLDKIRKAMNSTVVQESSRSTSMSESKNKLIAQIRENIRKIQDGSAGNKNVINVSKGVLQTVNGNKAIKEFMVYPDSNSSGITVKFSFPNSIDRSDYTKLLQDNFRAVAVDTSIASEDDKQKIRLNPVVFHPSEINTLLNNNTSMNAIIAQATQGNMANVAMIERSNLPSISTTNARPYEEDNVEEDEDNYDDF